jgi:excisionase family DNA binding protein
VTRGKHKPPPDPMSMREVAAYFRVSYATVQRMVATQHRFPNAYRVGWMWRIPLADVQAYEAEQLKKKGRR